MPCYEVRTVSVEFKVGNVDLLKKALEKAGCQIQTQDQVISFKDKFGNFAMIDFEKSKIISRMGDKQLADLSNSIKRAYSECVIDEVAKRNKWIKKQMGEGRFQLQRF